MNLKKISKTEIYIIYFGLIREDGKPLLCVENKYNKAL